MNKFLNKSLVFSIPFILYIIYLVTNLFSPPTQEWSGFLIFGEVQKDSLLREVDPPRIIFVGGSNLSFGLNSKMVKDSLNINPINTALHAGLGLVYMMNNTRKYLKNGDIIILVPEYEQFFGNVAYGEHTLLHQIFEVNPSKIFILTKRQISNLAKLLPEFSKSKNTKSDFTNFKRNDEYSVNSFNEYGDAFKHWVLERRDFEIKGKITTSMNLRVFQEIDKFRNQVEGKNGTLYISYPCLYDKSFRNNLREIELVQKNLENYKFNILGTPERYMMHDSMMFDTPYHLNKNGVDHRTKFFIQDFRKSRKE